MDCSTTYAFYRGCKWLFKGSWGVSVGFKGASDGFRVQGCCMRSQRNSGSSRSVSEGLRIDLFGTTSSNFLKGSKLLQAEGV